VLEVNYQQEFSTLGQLVAGAPTNAVVIYNAPIATMVESPSGGPYAASSWDNVSEFDLLARVVAGEATQPC
jgi:hypothetical protein